MQINNKFTLVSTFLLILLLYFSFTAGAELSEVGELKPLLEVEGVTSGDFGGGKVVGPENFDIVGDDIYVLSSEDDQLIHYRGEELVETYDLSDKMHYPTVVKVKEDRIYVLERHSRLFVFDKNINEINKITLENPGDEKFLLTNDIKFDNYGRPLVLKKDDTIIGFKKMSNEHLTGKLFYENSYGNKYKIEGNRIDCTERNLSFKIKSRGGGFISADLRFIDENDNLYIKVREDRINNIRKYNSQGELVAIGKLPSDENAIVHYPTGPRDVIVKGNNDIYAMANYEDKTVIYKVGLGKKLHYKVSE